MAAPKLAEEDIPKFQAVAAHMFTLCKEQRSAFSECMEARTKGDDCAAEFGALKSCAQGLIQDAAAKAKAEFKEYTDCLHIAGKYSYCREEQEKFLESFPLEKGDDDE